MGEEEEVESKSLFGCISAEGLSATGPSDFDFEDVERLEQLRVSSDAGAVDVAFSRCAGLALFLSESNDLKRLFP